MVSQTRFLYLFVKSAPCACRCRHCDFAVSGRLPTMPLARTLEYLRPFVEARDSGSAPYGALAVLLGEAPLNDPHLAGGAAYLREHDIEGWLSVPANGARFRTPEGWRRYLEALRQSGTECLEFTLYGKREAHDAFAGRKGDYDAIHTLASTWRDLGGKTLWGLFVHKGNLGDVREVCDEVQDVYGEPCSLSVWSYLGHGVALEELRPEASDLSGAVREQLRSLRPESESVRECAGSGEPAFPPEPRVIHMVLHADGRASVPYTPAEKGHDGITIGQVPSGTVDGLLHAWADTYDAWRLAYPTVGELCSRYGDSSCERLYDRHSVVRKWCAAHDLAQKGLGNTKHAKGREGREDRRPG